MARLQCRSCGFDNEIEWDGPLVCPSCGSTNARVAAATAEMPDEFFEAVVKSLLDAAKEPEIELSDSASVDPYESLKKALGREPTARDIEVYVATRRAARRDDA
jgi:uncharacterized Zn finger protein (UPF0148 family)